MAQNNYARRSKSINWEKVANVFSFSKEKAKSDTVTWKLPISKFEKKLMSFCGLILICLMITVISGKISLSNSQHNLETVQSQSASMLNKNTIMKEEINQLSNQSRLNKIAKKADLSLNPDSIRNVNK